MTLTGVIVGAGRQAITAPVLAIGYWVLGLPAGALLAFWGPQLGLFGLWLGMSLGVVVHAGLYLLVCFAPCQLPGVIRWSVAVQEARDRLEATPTAVAAAPVPVQTAVVDGDTYACVPLPSAADSDTRHGINR